MVEETHQHNLSVLSHMQSVNSENAYDSNNINKFEDEIYKMKSELYNLKEAENHLLLM